MNKLTLIALSFLFSVLASAQSPGLLGKKNLIQFEYRLGLSGFRNRTYSTTDDGVNSTESKMPILHTYRFSYGRILNRRLILGATYSYNSGRLQLSDYHYRIINDPKLHSHQVKLDFKFFGKRKLAGIGLYGRLSVGYLVSHAKDRIYTEPYFEFNNEVLYDYNQFDISFEQHRVIMEFGVGYSWLLTKNLLVNIEINAGYTPSSKDTPKNENEISRALRIQNDRYQFRSVASGLNFGITYVF